ncbi:MAG TPA: ADP-glyceromanno-heptose 6-epimerase [Chlamydiales bacterium]|nr:ADP-glyceromanno-heptose 6-epimerase [Chlamydiales bacterium]
MKRIVITGAAGMIGSGVVRHFNDLGNSSLILVDDLGNTDKWKNLLGKSFVDLIPPSKLFEYLRGREDEISAFIHLGACSDTTEKNADFLIENNFRFTIRLAEIACTWNKQFIYASSAATYGDGRLGFVDDENMLEELRPLNMYGFSKHLVDLWMKREGLLNRVVGLKYFNVFGPNEYHKAHMTSFVGKTFAKAKKEGKVSLFKSNDLASFADGEQSRDFIYLKDAVKMTCAFLSKRVGGIYNIGQGFATTWNQLAQYLFDALQKQANITYIEMPEDIRNQYQNYTCASMNKFNAIFQFQRTPTPDAVHEYVSQYLMSNARW